MLDYLVRAQSMGPWMTMPPEIPADHRSRPQELSVPLQGGDRPRAGRHLQLCRQLSRQRSVRGALLGRCAAPHRQDVRRGSRGPSTTRLAYT